MRTFPAGARPRLQRLFVALSLPAFVRSAVTELQRSPLPGFRWTPSERLHLTLKFIGEVEPALVDDIIEALAQIHVEPFHLPVEGVGRFPQRGSPQVAWVGVGGGHPRLFQLQYRIENALFAMGIEPDLRGYHPHITLARTSQAAPGAVNHFLKQHRDFEAPPFRATTFTLFSSHASSMGQVYREEAVWTLPEAALARRYA